MVLQRVEVALGIAGHGRVSVGVGHVEADVRADDAVELAAELQVAAEQPAMQVQVVRWLVHEVDAVGMPV
ncbi:hypothetical protein D3C81_1970240 [compost metagenome]